MEQAELYIILKSLGISSTSGQAGKTLTQKLQKLSLLSPEEQEREPNTLIQNNEKLVEDTSDENEKFFARNQQLQPLTHS